MSSFLTIFAVFEGIYKQKLTKLLKFILFAYCYYATALREVPEVCLANKNVSGLNICTNFVSSPQFNYDYE
jgi:elongation factor P hydroxylase